MVDSPWRMASPVMRKEQHAQQQDVTHFDGNTRSRSGSTSHCQEEKPSLFGHTWPRVLETGQSQMQCAVLSVPASLRLYIWYLHGHRYSRGRGIDSTYFLDFGAGNCLVHQLVEAKGFNLASAGCVPPTTSDISSTKDPRVCIRRPRRRLILSDDVSSMEDRYRPQLVRVVSEFLESLIPAYHAISSQGL
jgi:hypothetical protein